MTYNRCGTHATGVLLAVVWLTGSPAHAQSRPQPAVRATVGAGFSALDAGRADEAVRIAAAILEESPGSRAAALLQVSALAYHADPLEALAAYDAWRTRRRLDDPFLLAVIGEGVARRLADRATDPALKVAAAELLLRHGLPGARARLVAAARDAGSSGLAALARAGDGPAARQAAGALPTLQGSAKATAIDQLAGAASPAVTDAIVKLSGDPDPMVRIAVAGALGQDQDGAVVGPVLHRLLADPSGQVQQAAAVALVKRGDPLGEPLVEQMLTSGVGDLVLAAAEVLPGASARWTDAVRAVLESEDPVERLRAARLLKDVAPAEAAEVLSAALASQNVTLRDEAARHAVDGMPSAMTDWRRMLADPSGWVQLAGARVLLDAVGAPL